MTNPLTEQELRDIQARFTRGGLGVAPNTYVESGVERLLASHRLLSERLRVAEEALQEAQEWLTGERGDFGPDALSALEAINSALARIRKEGV